MRDWDLEKDGFFFLRRKKWRGGRVGEVWGVEQKKQRERESEELGGLWTVGSIVLLEICGGRVLKFERPFNCNGQDFEIFMFCWMVH